MFPNLRHDNSARSFKLQDNKTKELKTLDKILGAGFKSININEESHRFQPNEKFTKYQNNDYFEILETDEEDKDLQNQNYWKSKKKQYQP